MGWSMDCRAKIISRTTLAESLIPCMPCGEAELLPCPASWVGGYSKHLRTCLGFAHHFPNWEVSLPAAGRQWLGLGSCCSVVNIQKSCSQTGSISSPLFSLHPISFLLVS